MADAIEQALLPLVLVEAKRTSRAEVLTERTGVHRNRNADGLRSGGDGSRGIHFVMSACALSMKSIRLTQPARFY